MKYGILCALVFLTLKISAQNNLQFDDRSYDPLIRTVQSYADNGNQDDNIFPAIVALGQNNLVLEFDDLRNDRANYYVKLIHCNYDWSRSSLTDLDFLHDFNEFPINDYTFSGNTFQPYVHYRFVFPAVKVGGNYLAIVYRDDVSNLIISKRIMIYNPEITVRQDQSNSGTSALSFSRQPLNFTVDYSKTQVINPTENLHVVIRQNQRWDNAKSDLTPTFFRDGDSQLEFHPLNADNAFNGGNEFRFVDFRSLNYPGQNTGKLDKSVKPFKLSVAADQSRVDQSYSQYNDNNGQYLIDNKDTGDPKTDANYLPVTFFLKTASISDPVFVVGAFNNWAMLNENRMIYSEIRGGYEATVLLKQGMYNYQFAVTSKTLPSNYFEGDHFETENSYEILVYNHTFQPNADQLMGYSVIVLNPR